MRRKLIFALCMMSFLYATARAAEFRERPEWIRYFTDAGTQGTFVLYDLQHDRYQVSDRHRADTRFIPASTFKIPNSLIALDTGVVTDEHHVFPWDKTMREDASWNRDHTLRTALKYSVVPVYQGIARQIGAQRMQQMIQDLLSYTRAGGPAAERAAVDCEAVLAQVVSDLQVVITEQQATVTHDPLPTVPGEATRLKQVFQNLVAASRDTQ